MNASSSVMEEQGKAWKTFDGFVQRMKEKIAILSNDCYSKGVSQQGAMDVIFKALVKSTKYEDFKFPTLKGKPKKQGMKGIPKTTKVPATNPLILEIFDNFIENQRKFIIKTIEDEIEELKISKELIAEKQQQDTPVIKKEKEMEEEDEAEFFSDSEDENHLQLIKVYEQGRTEINELKRKKVELSPTIEKQEKIIDQAGIKLAKLKQQSDDEFLQMKKKTKHDHTIPTEQNDENILLLSEDVVEKTICDLVEADVKVLDVNMTSSTAFYQKFAKQLAAKTEKIDKAIKETQEAKEQAQHNFEQKLKELEEMKAKVIGPHLENLRNSEKLLEVQGKICKKLAAKEKTKNQERLRALLNAHLSDEEK